MISMQRYKDLTDYRENEDITLEPIFLETPNELKELKACEFEFNGNIHLIKNDKNEIVGAIEYRYISSVSDVYIELIEILEPYRKNGYAKKTINLIKRIYPKSNIFGQSLPKEETKYIWISLGADFNSCEEADCPFDSFEECRHHCDSPADYSFGISKTNYSVY